MYLLYKFLQIASILSFKFNYRDPFSPVISLGEASPSQKPAACHRVVKSDGQLSGYKGGSAMKRLLLDLEASASNKQCSNLFNYNYRGYYVNCKYLGHIKRGWLFPRLFVDQGYLGLTPL